MKYKKLRRSINEVSDSVWHDNFLKMDEFKLPSSEFIINKETPQQKNYKPITSVKLFKRGFMVLTSPNSKVDGLNLDYNDIITFDIK